MSKHIPSEFRVPLWIAHDREDPRGPTQLTYSLDYSVRPTGLTQARLRDRLIFKPKIDLGRYECRATIDWIWLECATGRETQSVHLSRKLTEALDHKVLATGPDLEHDEQPRNYTGRDFRIKLQDPTPELIRKVPAAINDGFGLNGEIRVLGIEIAVDFFPAPHVPDCQVEADRHRMVAVLQRHHLGNRRLFGEPRDDLRQVYPAFRSPEESQTEFIIPDAARLLTTDRELSDLQLRELSVQERILDLSNEHPLYLDATVYRGRKGGDVTYRVQNKVRDGSDPKLGPGVLLPLRRRRARVEVTLLHDGVADRGMKTLEDLFGFNFVALRNELFPMYLPTSPGGRRHAPKLRQVIDAAQAKLYRDAFVRGGCYAVSLYDEALTYRRRQLRTSRRRKEPKLPRLPRQRIGKNGNLIEWSEMNRRVEKALRGLSKGWRPSASDSA